MAGGMPQFLHELGQKSTWSLNQVHEALQRAGISRTAKASELRKGVFAAPDILKVGDMISANFGIIEHPAIIIRIEKDAVSAVILTTTEGPNNIYKVKESRYFNTGWVTNGITTISVEAAKARWIGEFDSPSDLKQIMKALRATYRSILSTDRGKKREKFIPIDFDKEDFGSMDDLD